MKLNLLRHARFWTDYEILNEDRSPTKLALTVGKPLPEKLNGPWKFEIRDMTKVAPGRFLSHIKPMKEYQGKRYETLMGYVRKFVAKHVEKATA